jgi:hypothetical protein
MASPRAVLSEVQGEEYIKPFLSSMSEGKLAWWRREWWLAQSDFLGQCCLALAESCSPPSALSDMRDT